MLENIVAQKPTFLTQNLSQYNFTLLLALFFVLGLLSLYKPYDRPNPLGDA